MASTRVLVDHDSIRRWADERGARPSRVKGTGGGGIGMIRLDFPGVSGAGTLEAVSWEQWFHQFDADRLALLVQDETGTGEVSHFNKLVSREEMATDHDRLLRRDRVARVAAAAADDDDLDDDDEDEDEEEEEQEEEEEEDEDLEYEEDEEEGEEGEEEEEDEDWDEELEDEEDEEDEELDEDKEELR